MLHLCQEELSWLQIPERIPAIEVANKIRFPLKSNVLSRVDFNLTPYLKEPISLIGDSKVRYIGIVAPTQSGKTVFLQVALADMIDQDPGSALYILPDEKMGKKTLQEKIIAIIKESPSLAKHMTGRARDISRTSVALDHMTIYPGWAGSLASLSSFPMKRVFWDEVRLMPLTTGAESNAIKLGGDRLTTYFDMGIGQGYMVSSPSVEGDLLHQQLSIKGTEVKVWQVPCLSCGTFQQLDFFKNVKYDKKNFRPRCLCKNCGKEFKDDDKKVSWNTLGKYVSTGSPKLAADRVFYRWDSMVSPFRSFTAIWNEFIQTKDKLHDYKNFYQCWLGKFWVDDISKTNAISLKERCLNYNTQTVPEGVKLVTAGIDTQDNGFVVEVRGFGTGKCSWLIDQFFISCDMSTSTDAEIIKLFTRDIFSRVYLKEDGEQWAISIAAIDSGGHRTLELYRVIHHFPKLFMIKGRNTQNTTIVMSAKATVPLYLVRTHEYLQETEDLAASSLFFLPQNITEDYCNQFCNIRKTLKLNKVNGDKQITWKKVGRCDYRMACVHTFICLDIVTDRGVLRHEVEKEKFEFNPIGRKDTLPKMPIDFEENISDYDINGINW